MNLNLNATFDLDVDLRAFREPGRHTCALARLHPMSRRGGRCGVEVNLNGGVEVHVQVDVKVNEFARTPLIGA